MDILRTDSGGCCPGNAPAEGEHEKREESNVEGVACHLARRVETPISIMTDYISMKESPRDDHGSRLCLEL